MNIKTISFTIPESVKDTKGTRADYYNYLVRDQTSEGKCWENANTRDGVALTLALQRSSLVTTYTATFIFSDGGLKHALTTMDLMFMTLRVKQNDHQSTVNVYCS